MTPCGTTAKAGHYLDSRGERTRPGPPSHERNRGDRGEATAVALTAVTERLQGELSDQDKLVYVNNVITEKLLESKTLQQQAANNTKQQFATSPDLPSELTNACISAYDAHTSMSTQALNSPSLRAALLDILLNYTSLYERLRAAGGAASHAP